MKPDPLQRSPKHVVPRALFAAVIAASCTVGAGGCYLGDTGLSPLYDQVYYPTGLVVSAGRKSLYVVNSDFDLQYNGGTVQVLNLETLRDNKVLPLLTSVRKVAINEMTVEAACAPVGVSQVINRQMLAPVNDNTILSPGPCKSFPLKQFDRARSYDAVTNDGDVMGSVEIGAFASGAALVHNEQGVGARLFVAVRGDPSITWFKVTDDREGKKSTDCGGADHCLDCGAVDMRCKDTHRLGTHPYDNPRRLTLPIEPVGEAASDDGSLLFVAHQTEATVSVSFTGYAGPSIGVLPSDTPKLQFYLQNTAIGPTEVVAVPRAGLVTLTTSPPVYQPGFLVSYRDAAELDLFRYNDDANGVPPRPFITLASALPVFINADGKDSRGLAIDASERKACEATCGMDEVCLRECAAIPLPFFMANRSPPSLIVGRVTTEVVGVDLDHPAGTAVFDRIELIETVPLTEGPSKVSMGQVITPEGKLAWRAFAVSFDSRKVFSYDPVAHRIDAVIESGRGPHAIAFDTDPSADPAYSLLYVGHFTDSYLGVVDLDMRHPETFGTMFASVGTPTPPRESK